MSGVIAALGLRLVLAAQAAEPPHAAVPPPPAILRAPAIPPASAAPPAPAADGGARPSSPPLLGPIRGGPSAPADRTYELRRARDGSGDLVYEGPAFTARIARDGAAQFSDKHVSISRSWSLIPFAPLAGPAGRPSIESVVTDFLARRSPRRAERGRTDDAKPLPTIIPGPARYRPDPREACQYPRACYFEPVVLPGVGGGFDLTDELMRLGGQDPYGREKALFLASTRDLRDKMAARAIAEDVRLARADLGARMLAVACDGRRSERERLAIIEALRLELDGPTAAAHEAVAMVARFLASFVEGGADAVHCPRVDGGAAP